MESGGNKPFLRVLQKNFRRSPLGKGGSGVFSFFQGGRAGAESPPGGKIPAQRKIPALFRLDGIDPACLFRIVVVKAGAVLFFQKGERAAVGGQTGVFPDEPLQVDPEKIRDPVDFPVRDPYRSLPFAACSAPYAAEARQIFLLFPIHGNSRLSTEKTLPGGGASAKNFLSPPAACNRCRADRNRKYR